MPKSAPKSKAKRVEIPSKITNEQKQELLTTLEQRFIDNKARHQGINWEDVLNKLEAQPKKLITVYAMEVTGGEPDVVAHNKDTNKFTIFDCSKQSPEMRRSLCFDKQAWDDRKANKPDGNAIDIAKEIGIEILNEEQYRMLQTLGEFDTTTSSWIATPVKIRNLGGAVFADRRYDTVFVYHNGAESYYGSRGFRGSIEV